ncbi:hypothetical protein TNCV_1732981 [Trichonephila clavipes]|nr:hypothetical protein TNCV_1732981 [Trichonephila clavipes]
MEFTRLPLPDRTLHHPSSSHNPNPLLEGSERQIKSSWRFFRYICNANQMKFAAGLISIQRLLSSQNKILVLTSFSAENITADLELVPEGANKDVSEGCLCLA